MQNGIENHGIEETGVLTRDQKGGSMRIAISVIGILLAGTGCGKATSDANTTQPAANPPSVLVKVAPATFQPITRTLTAYGTVEYSPEGARVMNVQAEGVVSQVLVAVGQQVHKGDALVRLEPSASARLELEKARIEVDFARKEVQRLIDLRTRQLATNAEVASAQKALATAEAALVNIRKRQVGGATQVLRAAVAGTVEAVNVEIGQVAAPGTPLVRIGNRERLRVKLGVEQEVLQQIEVGQQVAVRPLNSAAAAITSSIARVYRQIDPKTRLAEAVVPLPASDGLLPGAMVRADITLQSNPHALVVPRSAVLYRRGIEPYVFVDDQGRAREHSVLIGEDNGDVVEIRQGLVAQQNVVTLGNAELTDGVAIRTEPAK